MPHMIKDYPKGNRRFDVPEFESSLVRAQFSGMFKLKLHHETEQPCCREMRMGVAPNGIGT